jgi:hypothetical protein
VDDALYDAQRRELHERRVENDGLRGIVHDLRLDMHRLRGEMYDLREMAYQADIARASAENRVVVLEIALRELVNRCDGAEGVQDDGSNMSTMAAHAVLGDFDEQDEQEAAK